MDMETAQLDEQLNEYEMAVDRSGLSFPVRTPLYMLVSVAREAGSASFEMANSEWIDSLGWHHKIAKRKLRAAAHKRWLTIEDRDGTALYTLNLHMRHAMPGEGV